MALAIDRSFEANTEIIIHTPTVPKSVINNTGELLDDMRFWSYGQPYGEALSDGTVMVVYYAGTEEGMEIHWAKLRLTN